MVQHRNRKQQIDRSSCFSPMPPCSRMTRQNCCSQVSYLHHRELTKPVTKTSNAWDKLAYYRIANHYKFILKTFFDCFGYPHVIILEVSHFSIIMEQICILTCSKPGPTSEGPDWAIICFNIVCKPSRIEGASACLILQCMLRSIGPPPPYSMDCWQLPHVCHLTWIRPFPAGISK